MKLLNKKGPLKVTRKSAPSIPRKERRVLKREFQKAFKKASKRKLTAESIEATADSSSLQPRKVGHKTILNETSHDPTKQLSTRKLVLRIVALAQTLAEKQFYPYQAEIAYRIAESILMHDGEVITALIARQSGKTECLSGIVTAIGIIMPLLAKRYPDDWKLNITDDQGVYRGFRDGVKIGIYAPRLEQAEIMFNRIKHAIESDTGQQVLAEMGLKSTESNGDRIRLSNGTRILCQSASEQSKIEGETHHLLICEEAQDISDLKVRKSLHPMVSSLLGTIVKIGTASTKKCDFYSSIKTNERMELIQGKRNHFFYPHTVTERYNSLYRRYVENERQRLGEDSDEFRLAYNCEWIFERGMFVTQSQLFAHGVALTDGIFSMRHPEGLHKNLSQYSVVVGIDWGASSDSTVVTSLAVDWKNPVDSGEYQDLEGIREFVVYKKQVLNWLEFIGDNYENQFWQIVEYLNSLPNLKKIVMDSNTCGKPLFDRFSAMYAGRGIEVVPFNFQAKLKSDGYKSLYADICSKRLTFPACKPVRKTLQWKKFVNQMLDLRKEYKNGLMSCAHPDEKGAHDDYPDSLMMAAYGANTQSYGSGFEVLDNNPFFR